MRVNLANNFVQYFDVMLNLIVLPLEMENKKNK